MVRRRTRDEVLRAEDHAVRLAARGLNTREIGQALGLSESEARRKLQKGLARRRGESSAASAWERVDAALAEALRTAYRDHDDAPVGSPQRVGAMKVIVELPAWQEAREPREICPQCEKRVERRELLELGCPWCGWLSARAEAPAIEARTAHHTFREGPR